MLNISTKNRDRKRAAIGALIAFGVLLVLAVGGGAAYAWWSGRHSKPVSTVNTEPRKPLQRQAVAPQVDPKTPVGVSSQSFTSPAVPGTNVSLDIRTKPLSDCVIEVTYDKTKSTDSGLKPKKADEFGFLSWTWSVEPNQPIGEWPVKVTCKNGEKSGFLELKLKLVKSLE